MSSDTKNLFDVFFSFAQLIALVAAGLWAYCRFWRESQHAQRIELNISCEFFEPKNGVRIASFSLHAINRGHVEQRFVSISLRILGLKATDPLALGPDRRLSFPHDLTNTEVIPDKSGYYFVRPGVAQRFSYTTTVPENARYILAHAAFRYEGGDLHTTERVFDVHRNA